MRFSKIALAVVLFVFIFKAVHTPFRPTLDDFRVYETAALLVQEHRGALIYDGADTGEDPQLRFASQGSPFAQTAHSIGVDQVRLYVYPPLLADLLVPFTWVSPSIAARIWEGINIAAVLVTGALILQMMGVAVVSLAGAVILLGAFTFYPVLGCLVWGQITILLLLLWTVGVYCYRRGWLAASAAAFALATAIKLTPLIVIAPLFIWGEWKWLRNFAVALLVCIAAMAVINTPSSLPHYFQHVMPSMSAGVPTFDNKSILASMQVSWQTWASHGGGTVTTTIPHSVLVAGKLLALGCAGIAVLLVLRSRKAVTLRERVLTLTLFAMLSVAISPVSWKHAYAIAFLALACLWIEAIKERRSAVYVVILSVCTLEVAWSIFGLFTAGHAHNIGFASWVTPGAVVLLVFYRLAAFGSVKELAESSKSTPQAA